MDYFMDLYIVDAEESVTVDMRFSKFLRGAFAFWKSQQIEL